MSKFIILLALIGFVCAAPVTEDETTVATVVQILKSESDQSEDGSYTFLYESGDGSSRKEEAVINNKGTDEESIKVSGQYKYTDSDGKEVVVSYTADENGFVPVGTTIAQEISDTASAAKDLPKQGEDLPKNGKDLAKSEEKVDE